MKLIITKLSCLLDTNLREKLPTVEVLSWFSVTVHIPNCLVVLVVVYCLGK